MMNSSPLMMEKRPLLPTRPQWQTAQGPPRTSIAVFLAAALSTIVLFHSLSFTSWPESVENKVARVQQCSIDNLKSDLSFLDDAKSIEASEFLERRDRLAQALVTNGVDGFFLEPGYTFQ